MIDENHFDFFQDEGKFSRHPRWKRRRCALVFLRASRTSETLFFIFYFDILILDLGTLYFSFCLTSQVIYKQPEYESFGDSTG